MLTKSEHELHALLDDRVKKFDHAFSLKGEQSEEADRLFKMSSDLATESSAMETQIAESERGSKEAAKGAHKQLQGLMGRLYPIGLEMERSLAKALVTARMRKVLKENEIAIAPDASVMQTVVKFVVRGVKKQSTHIYARRLEGALANGLTPEQFAKDLEDNGVTKVAKTPKQLKEAEQAAAELEDRVALFKRAVRHVAKEFDPPVQWSRGVIQIAADDPGELLFCIGMPEEGDKLRLAYCVQIGFAQENGIAAAVSAVLGSDHLHSALARSTESLAAHPVQRKNATRKEHDDVPR
jgi:hypothetical protein